MPSTGWHYLTAQILEAPLNVVPLRALVREGSETILKLDEWLVVVSRDGHFHLDDCSCEQCHPVDEYLKAA